MHRTPRRLLIALAAVAGAFALAGCVNLKSFTGSQTTSIGGVQITSVICRSGSTGCADNGGNSTLTPNANANVDSQVLIAYRATTGSKPPATLRFFDDDGLGPLFTPSPSYTAELQRLSPAPAGQQWFGYISSKFTSTGTVTQGSIITRFGMPVAADGTPVSTYAYLVVVGAREADAQNDPNRPVSCGDSPFAVSDGGVCIDSPIPNDVTSFKTLQVSDLGIAARAAAPVAPGAVASVPFTLRTSPGTAGSPTAVLSATTVLPGGAATAAPGSLVLAPGATTDAAVSVSVPAGTAPGTYPVTLTATVGPEVRTAQGAVVVTARGGGGTAGLPSLTATVAPKSVKRTRRAAPAVVTATLSDPGNLRMAVSRAAVGRRRATGVCAAPTRTLIRNGAPRCTRFVPVTTITKAGLGAGARTILFSGRGRVPGTYRLSLTLRAGGRVSLPAIVTVTVKP